jgi:hypothetical protein
MSIYGDMGNILAMQYRLEKRGFEVVYQTGVVGRPLPEITDFYFIGGGQDNEQYIIFQDLLTKKHKLLTDIESGVSLLSICGGYQLLGESFLTGDGRQIEGIGLFPVETRAPDASVKSRCIGNIVTDCQIPELSGYKLVGFENHGGQTVIKYQDQKLKSESGVNHNLSVNRESGVVDSVEGTIPLGKTLSGFGNNIHDGTEGCVYKHAIGTYLHGSCLPKNPLLADWLIQKSLESRLGKSVDLEPLNDTIAQQTRDNLIARFA